MTTRCRKLPTRMVEKVWGRTELPDPFAVPKELGEAARIGEIWFEPPAEMPDLLVKYLFTSEKLSVQVHPSDDQALPGEQGKEECWLVLDAEPGASLAIGFDEAISSEAMRAAALDGSIEQLLTWHEVKAGDVFYLPAGTVHAIGPGLALVEVQQASDTTFRLYDYGRPRDLHLERALAVADGSPYSDEHRGSIATRGKELKKGAHFRLDRLEGAPDAALKALYSQPLLALPISGHLKSGDGAIAASGGECLYCESIDALDFSEAGVTLLTRVTSA